MRFEFRFWRSSSLGLSGGVGCALLVVGVVVLWGDSWAVDLVVVGIEDVGFGTWFPDRCIRGKVSVFLLF